MRATYAINNIYKVISFFELIDIVGDKLYFSDVIRYTSDWHTTHDNNQKKVPCLFILLGRETPFW